MSDTLSKYATWQELSNQPALWKRWFNEFDPQPLQAWIQSLPIEEIWFSGAGTSAYIGDIIAAGLERSTSTPHVNGKPLRLRSIPSTDIVSRPKAYQPEPTTLVVNFGRSGDSAETVGVLDALEQLAPDTPTLNITCNSTGQLATRKSQSEQRVVVLPDDSHDSGFAMTASFSTMLATALSIFDSSFDTSTINTVADELTMLLPQFQTQALQETLPDRTVFLGAGPLAFAAREASLKVLELTAGQVASTWESTLGFRHGPKSFVTDNTTIYLFLSNDQQARRYDLDLVNELKRQFPDVHVGVVGTQGDVSIDTNAPDRYNALLMVAFAQVLAVVWSHRLGLNVDNPFEGKGTLTRVVSGVKLHPVNS